MSFNDLFGFNPNAIQYPTSYQTPRTLNLTTTPYQYQLQQMPKVEYVNGVDSVKQFATQPNTMGVAFDANEDIFYIKVTDASNFPVIKKFRFEEVVDEQLPSKLEAKYVTMEEFNAFKEALLNGEQFKGTSKSSKSANKSAGKAIDADV